MSEDFRNAPIDVSSLPQLSDENFVSLDPRYLRVSLLRNAVFAATVVVICVVIATQVAKPWIPLLVMGVLLVLTALSSVLRVIEVGKMGYQVRDHDVSYRYGVITLTVETLPFRRVQHATLNSGAIERKFGLATLTISSAGSRVTIPGLAAADAERIRALVVERAGEVTEVA